MHVPNYVGLLRTEFTLGDYKYLSLQIRLNQLIDMRHLVAVS